MWGLHTVKAGAYYEYVSNAQPNSANSNGFIIQNNWASNTSGNTFADLLMGNLGNYSEASLNKVNDMHYNLLEGYIQDSWKVKPRLTLDLGLRLSYLGPWTDNNGLGMAAWDQSKYASELAAGTNYPGITYTAKDPSAPLSGVDGSWFFVTPRFGFAWDTKGTGETVVRGGIGMYRYHEPQSIYSGLLGLGQGQRSYSADNVTLKGVEGLGSGALPGAGSAIDIDDDKQPLGYTWSLNLNQKLPWSMNVELGYVGSKNENLLNEGIANINAVPLGAMINDPDGNAGRCTGPIGLRRPERVPAQRVHQLPRAAGPPEPPARELQLHGEPTRSRRSSASARARTGTPGARSTSWTPSSSTTASRGPTARTWRASRSPGS